MPGKGSEKWGRKAKGNSPKNGTIGSKRAQRNQVRADRSVARAKWNRDQRALKKGEILTLPET